MRYQIILSLFTFVLIALPLQGCSKPEAGRSGAEQGEQQSYADAQSAANASLATFRKLVTSDNYKEMGFESPGEVVNATLGDPMRVYLVKLDQLKEYKQGGDPNALLTDLNRIVYPVVVREQVRSSITVEAIDGKWKTTTFGQGATTKQIAEAKKAVAANSQSRGAEPFIVHVAALNLYFVGHRADNKLMLTPIVSVDNYKLRAGVTMPAEEVFSNLAPFARSYNGQPL